MHNEEIPGTAKGPVSPMSAAPGGGARCGGERNLVTTFGDIVEPVRTIWLARIDRAWRAPCPAPLFPEMYRPLGGALLLRLFRDPALDLVRADVLAVDAAQTMLARWCEASEGDTTPVPEDCVRPTLLETAHAVVLAFWEQHWAGVAA